MNTLISKHFVKASLPEVWTFFSNPANLRLITPPAMNFRITSPELPEKIYPGMIIIYKVSPVFHLRMTWVTEITQVREFEYFIDNQKHGPYQYWHHQHHFKPKNNGVEMTDIVHYKAPLGPIGKLAEIMLVDQKVKSIFTYRSQVIDDIFK